MKKTIIYAFVLLLMGTAVTSCEDAFGDFLDKDPSNELTEEEVFSDWTTLKAFHYDTYNFLRNGAGRVNYTWMDAATDLAHTSFAYGTRTSFNIGNYYATSASDELTGTWEHFYRGIRKCNMLLERIDDVPKASDLSAEQFAIDKTNYIAESRFMRAFFYWEMFLRYGTVPLVTEVLDPDGDLLTGYTTRPDLKTYMDWVLQELAECEPNLMDNPLAIDQKGRICKAMARALASRIKLYMASDRFSAESGITWQNAADAAASFIADYGSGYGLYVGDTNPVNCYTNAILKNAHDESNNEVIFWRNDVKIYWATVYYDTPVGEGGMGGCCPSQNLVDMYDMANGLSPFSSYDATGAPVYNGTTVPAVNSASGYSENAPYSNRDPRLAASVLFNGSSWGNGVVNVIKGQRDNPVGNANATPTGYYMRKYMPEQILNNDHTGSSYRNWIFIRYAEILLNYAEAMNEANGPGTEVFDALQQIRNRVGMTAKLADRADLQNKESLRNFIRKERTIELAFEDHRAWDVRRWNVAVEALARPIYGMDVAKDGNQLTYTRKVVQNRVFESKMYLYPIPETEVWKTNIENNPGW